MKRNIVFVVLLAIGAVAVKCPCEDPSLCKPLSISYAREGYGFWSESIAVNINLEDVENAITTLAWPPLPNVDPDVVCRAHRAGIRLIPGATRDLTEYWDSESKRLEWARKSAQAVKEMHYDGLVFDVEGPLNRTDPAVDYYTKLVETTTKVFHEVIPGSQVSVCVAWNAYNVDGRAYDYAGLGKASDLLYIMSYDVQSQVVQGRCIAQANCPLTAAIQGAKSYLDLGIPAKKLILGIPWYGFGYPCEPGTDPKSRFCPLRYAPFRGVNCSDALGHGWSFSAVEAFLQNGNSTTGRLFEEYQASAFMNYVQGGVVYQVFWDDVPSMQMKYAAAANLGLRGVGPFQWFDADISTPAGRAMYKALGEYRKH